MIFTVIYRIWKYLCSLLIIILSLVPIIFALPIYAFRFFVSSTIIRCYPEVDKLLESRSALFGMDVQQERPKGSIIAVTMVEGIADLNKTREAIKAHVINRRNESGDFKNPEFQQYVDSFWGFLAWKWEPNFDIKDHIVLYNGIHRESFRDVNIPIKPEQLMDICNEMTSKPFTHKMSPWVMHLIQNCRETDSPDEPTQTAIILQTHHSLCDGFSMLKAIFSDLTSAEKEKAIITKHTRSNIQKSLMSRIGNALDFVLSAPYEMLTELIAAKDGLTVWHVPEKQLQRNLNGAVSKVLELDSLKIIKNRHKVPFTVLILECFTAALRKFMKEAGLPVPNVIHCLSPLPVPDHPDQMVNHMTGCFIPLPVGLSDPIQRLKAIEADIAHISQTVYPIAAFYLLPLVGSLFPWMFKYLVRNDVSTAIISNLPDNMYLVMEIQSKVFERGTDISNNDFSFSQLMDQGPSNALMFANHRILSMSFCAGFFEGNLGMGFSAFSYNGTIRIAAGVDNGIVDRNKLSGTKLIEYFLEEAELLKKLAPA